MAGISHTLLDVVEKVKAINPNAEGAVADSIMVTGQKPKEITAHMTGGDYLILGFKPNDFIDRHGGDVFKLEVLEAKFKTICPDYDEELQADVESQALQYCSIMIYTVGPESRTVKPKSGDKCWTFKFVDVNKTTGEVKVKVAYVCTFKTEATNTYNMSWSTSADEEDSIVMSIKHASLLAVKVMNRLTEYTCRLVVPVYMLTPLCGAIFSKENLEEMSKDTGIEIKDLIIALNSSCQSGGHYLETSDNAMATLAAIVATAKLGAKGKHEERLQIIGKITKQYIAAGKELDRGLFVRLAKYATGGLPAGMDPASMIKLFNDAKKPGKEISMMRAAAASKMTQLQVRSDNLEYRDSSRAGFEDKDEFNAYGGLPADHEADDYDYYKAIEQSKLDQIARQKSSEDDEANRRYSDSSSIASVFRPDVDDLGLPKQTAPLDEEEEKKRREDEEEKARIAKERELEEVRKANLEKEKEKAANKKRKEDRDRSRAAAVRNVVERTKGLMKYDEATKEIEAIDTSIANFNKAMASNPDDLTTQGHLDTARAKRERIERVLRDWMSIKDYMVRSKFNEKTIKEVLESRFVMETNPDKFKTQVYDAFR